MALRTVSRDSPIRFTRRILCTDEAIIFIGSSTFRFSRVSGNMNIIQLLRLGGVPRSGTTLMRAMLDSHPDIRWYVSAPSTFSHASLDICMVFAPTKSCNFQRRGDLHSASDCWIERSVGEQLHGARGKSQRYHPTDP